MDRFIIEGPTRLEGELAVGGAKNAVLPLMAAACSAGARPSSTTCPICTTSASS